MSNPNESNVARQTADRVVARERRRIRMWAVLTVGLWLVAALLMTGIYLPYGAKLNHFIKQLDEENPGINRSLLIDRAPNVNPPPPKPEEIPAAIIKLQREQWIIAHIVGYQWLVGAGMLSLAIGAAILASVSTVALSLTIRRMTLRRVNEGLAQIAEQLRRLDVR
jgi:hypothetical protein